MKNTLQENAAVVNYVTRTETVTNIGRVSAIKDIERIEMGRIGDIRGQR